MERDEEQQKKKRKSLFAPTKPSIFSPADGAEQLPDLPDFPTDLSTRLDDLEDCGCFGKK